MTAPRILVAGIGNIFLGDDGFGCAVAERLARRGLPPDKVRVADFGIRGLDLAYALLEDYDLTIFVDAAPRGGEPGTLYVIEPDLTEFEDPDAPAPLPQAHGLHPQMVLALVKAMGGEFRRVLVVGCEPASFGDEDGAMGLSEPVQAAVGEAAALVVSLVNEQLNGCSGAAVS